MLFNEAIKNFDAVIEKEKSYIIWNEKFRHVSEKYWNANDEIELSFTTAK